MPFPFVITFLLQKSLKEQKSHTIHFGTIRSDSNIIDEVLVSIFKKPHSYTGEDVIEVSCHGSSYIQNQLLHLFLEKGVRMAQAGEFTLEPLVMGRWIYLKQKP